MNNSHLRTSLFFTCSYFLNTQHMLSAVIWFSLESAHPLWLLSVWIFVLGVCVQTHREKKQRHQKKEKKLEVWKLPAFQPSPYSRSLQRISRLFSWEPSDLMSSAVQGYLLFKFFWECSMYVFLFLPVMPAVPLLFVPTGPPFPPKSLLWQRAGGTFCGEAKPQEPNKRFWPIREHFELRVPVWMANWAVHKKVWKHWRSWTQVRRRGGGWAEAAGRSWPWNASKNVSLKSPSILPLGKPSPCWGRA